MPPRALTAAWLDGQYAASTDYLEFYCLAKFTLAAERTSDLLRITFLKSLQ
jgi:hypothetical protein